MSELYIKQLECSNEELKAELQKQKDENAKINATLKEIISKTTAEYENKITVMKKEYQNEVQKLNETIKEMEFHIDALIRDNTVMDAQLDIVKMMCGVQE